MANNILVHRNCEYVSRQVKILPLLIIVYLIYARKFFALEKSALYFNWKKANTDDIKRS